MSQVLSQRFAGAARREQQRLERRRDQLQGAVDRLEEQIRALDGLAAEPIADDAPGTLRGRRIREVAVALLREDRGTAPIHYREWLVLVEAAGCRIAGKRPESVFHNQVARHPEVRPTTSRGVFVLVDPPASVPDPAPLEGTRQRKEAP